MKNSHNSQKSSNKNIIELVNSISESIKSYNSLKTIASKSHEREELINQLAASFESVLQNYSLAIRNYRLLTFVYEQTSKEDLRKITKKIAGILMDEIKDPSKVGDIDVKEYARLSQETSALNQALQSLNHSVLTELEAHQRTWLDRTRLSRQILRIPDLAGELADPEDLLSCMEQIEDFLEKAKNTQDNRSLDTLKKDWFALRERFGRYKNIESYEGIRQTYSLSDETVEIIKGLLNEAEIPLSSISSIMLKELYEFKDFCQVITLKFKPLEETTNEI